jgi:PucR family transcriptional regulator, purine catabolism regulatory protein
MSESQELTLAELVTEAQLGLTVLTGELGLARVIKNVHHSDFADPTPWMADGTLLITHGAALAESAEAGVRYVERVSSKTAALVVAVGEYVDHVPPGVVKHAVGLGLPVLEAPRTLSLRDIFSYVYHSLSSSDMHRLRRALAVQSQLLGLLAEDKSIDDVVARLSEILDLPIVLFDSEGSIVATAGSQPLDAGMIWNVVAGANFSGGPTGVVEADGWRIYVRRVDVHGELARVLAAVPRSFVTSILVDMTLTYAQRLIGLNLLAEREVIRVRRTMVSALLREFLGHEDDASEYAERLAAVGVDIGMPWRVAVFSAERQERATSRRSSDHGAEKGSLLERIVDVVEESFRGLGVKAITTVADDAVIAVAVVGVEARVTVRAALTQVQQQIRERVPGALTSVGVSGEWIGAARPAVPLRQAEEASRAAREGAGVVEGVVLFDEATTRFRLLEGQSPDALAAMSDRVLGPLADHDRAQHTAYVKTIRVFLRNRMSVHETASELFIHRNTLHKRLARVEELLGMDLSHMDDVMELYVALKAVELLEAPEASPGAPPAAPSRGRHTPPAAG